jgi:glycosyltransferase involved in cell wall biosynthesis
MTTRPLIVIPAFNEARNLGSILEEVVSFGLFDVVIVDDNSTDDTRNISLNQGVVVLPLRVRLGAWGATQTGIRYGVMNGYETIVTMDADGQHNPADIPGLLSALQANNADVVIGSYPDRGSLARHVAWWCFRRLSGVKLEDLTSGLKVYSRRAAMHLVNADATIFDYQDLGVVLYLLHNNMRVIESEVVMSKRSDGKSKIFNSWLLVLKYMMQTIILCLSMRSFNNRKGTQENRRR